MAGGGGGSGAPATVSPTANTSTVQHASNQAGKGGGGAGIPAVDTTSTFPDQTAGVDGGAGGGKSGGAGSPPPNDIQFGGYGQQSPFGLTNPASWGESGGADLTGTTSSNVTNQFTGSDFYNQQSPQPVAEAAAVADNTSSFDDETPTAGAIDTGAGTTLNYDAGEQQAAQNIANTIEAGGINAATGDNNISAGPNVLSAGDDGLFGWGDDYNNEFQQNYAAQSAHAEANPYGMSTGTPLTEQGFVQEGGLADTFINGSTIGRIGSALTGKNLMSTTADLLPPPPGSERDAAGEYGKTGEEVEGGGILSGIESATGLNLTGPIDPSINLHRGGGYDNRSSHSTDNDSIAKDLASSLPHGGGTWSPSLGRHLNPTQIANRAAAGLPLNMGGPIPYNKGGPIPPGGK